MELTGIIKGVTNRVASGVGMLPADKEKVAQARLIICKSCEIFDTPTSKCSKEKGGCGCYMTTKVYCMECTCPKQKW